VTGGLRFAAPPEGKGRVNHPGGRVEAWESNRLCLRHPDNKLSGLTGKGGLGRGAGGAGRRVASGLGATGGVGQGCDPDPTFNVVNYLE